MNELQQKSSAPVYDDEIDLGELFRVLWAGKWLICGITFAAAVIAFIVALILPNVYRADALLAPNDQEGAGGSSALAAQYGGLASLAGIDLGSSGSDAVSLGLTTLKSRKFITDFIDRHDLLVSLVAAKAWNPDSGDLEIDSDIYDVGNSQWLLVQKRSGIRGPSRQTAYDSLADIMSVTRDEDTGVISLEVRHKSPLVAKELVDQLIVDINAVIRDRDVTNANRAIEFLKSQLANTSFTQLHAAMYRLIEQQMKIVMLSQISDEYLFRTVDPAIIPDEPDSPNRVLIVLIGMVTGFIIALIIVLSVFYFRILDAAVKNESA